MWLKTRSKEVRKLVPKDPVSILILAKYYHLHTGIWTKKDYDRDVETKDTLDQIQWLNSPALSTLLQSRISRPGIPPHH